MNDADADGKHDSPGAPRRPGGERDEAGRKEQDQRQELGSHEVLSDAGNIYSGTEIPAKLPDGKGKNHQDSNRNQSSHAFEEAPADHELFLLLADIAAEYNVPIDIHMDPVLEDGPTPDEFLSRSQQNPATLRGNITPFEALLAHNRNARIVWAHTADTTGDLSPELLQGLLDEHPNLYLSLRLSFQHPRAIFPEHILDGSRNIQPEWLDLIKAYPDRFVIGSDTFWGDSKADLGQTLVSPFLAQLPENIATKIAHENVAVIYKLEME